MEHSEVAETQVSLTSAVVPFGFPWSLWREQSTTRQHAGGLGFPVHLAAFARALPAASLVPAPVFENVLRRAPALGQVPCAREHLLQQLVHAPRLVCAPGPAIALAFARLLVRLVSVGAPPQCARLFAVGRKTAALPAASFQHLKHLGYRPGPLFVFVLDLHPRVPEAGAGQPPVKHVMTVLGAEPQVVPQSWHLPLRHSVTALMAAQQTRVSVTSNCVCIVLVSCCCGAALPARQAVHVPSLAMTIVCERHAALRQQLVEHPRSLVERLCLHLLAVCH